MKTLVVEPALTRAEVEKIGYQNIPGYWGPDLRSDPTTWAVPSPRLDPHPERGGVSKPECMESYVGQAIELIDRLQRTALALYQDQERVAHLLHPSNEETWS